MSLSAHPPQFVKRGWALFCAEHQITSCLRDKVRYKAGKWKGLHYQQRPHFRNFRLSDLIVTTPSPLPNDKPGA
jgi:hypothetical protein